MLTACMWGLLRQVQDNPHAEIVGITEVQSADTGKNVVVGSARKRPES